VHAGPPRLARLLARTAAPLFAAALAAPGCLIDDSYVIDPKWGDEEATSSSSSETLGSTSSASVSAASSGGGAGGSGEGGAGGAGGAVLGCGEDPVPTGVVCPLECTGGCAAGVCSIACSGTEQCKGQTIVCPLEFACRVQCGGDSSCEGAKVKCPEGLACTLECTALQSCKAADLTCGSGSCAASCDAWEACRDTELFCGSGACSATCTDEHSPKLECGAACLCANCPTDSGDG